MPPVDFGQLPFTVRPDLTPYLIHLTRGTEERDEYSAFDNLVSILKTGRIWGSTRRGFIKGARPAACFMDVPFIALKDICTKGNEGRYEPYGVVVTKKLAYKKGARPVLYLSNAEVEELNVPPGQLWRVVRFEVSDAGWISWLHEREWRTPDEFSLPKAIRAVVVKTHADAMALQAMLNDAGEGEFKCIPASILPLEIVCQGLNRE